MYVFLYVRASFVPVLMEMLAIGYNRNYVPLPIRFYFHCKQKSCTYSISKLQRTPSSCRNQQSQAPSITAHRAVHIANEAKSTTNVCHSLTTIYDAQETPHGARKTHCGKSQGRRQGVESVRFGNFHLSLDPYFAARSLCSKALLSHFFGGFF